MWHSEGKNMAFGEKCTCLNLFVMQDYPLSQTAIFKTSPGPACKNTITDEPIGYLPTLIEGSDSESHEVP